jgi:Putative beta-barrel porin-2, OmpL-like. bbp2
MLRKISLSIVIFACSLSVFAQASDSTKKAMDTTKPAAAPAPNPVVITGSADLYYRYAFNKVNFAPTSFTQTHDQFQLGMATVKLEHKTTKMDMVADLGFGPRAQTFDYTEQNGVNGGGILQAVKQLYISYSPNAVVKFTGGTWATHIGYEVMDAFGNRNYSMSYMFTNGPFSHTGVRADFTFGKSGFMIGVSNPSDWRTVPSSYQNNKNMIAQYSWLPSDNFHLYLNYVGGRDTGDNKVHQYDLVINSKINSMFGIGVNGTYNHSSPHTDYTISHNWYGAAIYLLLDPTPWFGLTLREEYFSDKDAVKTPGGSVIASTLSASFKVDGFTFIPEFRLDAANNPWFPKSDGTTSKSDPSFILAAVYSF